MNEVGEVDRIMDEEDWDIIADQIEIAFLGIEFGGEATHITRQVAGAARDGGDATNIEVFSPTR